MKYRSEETVPHCLECGNPLPYGRKDRKFCCPACKNRNHNREARRWRFRHASVIGILENNHEILRHLIQIGVRSIPKEELIQLGYRMGFVTSSGRDKGRRKGMGKTAYQRLRSASFYDSCPDCLFLVRAGAGKSGRKNKSYHAGFPLFQTIVKTRAIFLAILGIAPWKGHLHAVKRGRL